MTIDTLDIPKIKDTIYDSLGWKNRTRRNLSEAIWLFSDVDLACRTRGQANTLCEV